IAADDEGRRVVYISSFSKTLAPGFRVAWLSGPEPIVEKVELAKQAEDLSAGGLDQRVVYGACRRGVLTRQLPRLRAAYQQRRDEFAAALHRHLADALSWTPPRGGFFLWAKLPAAVAASRLLDEARQRGVIFVTGDAFFVNGQ